MTKSALREADQAYRQAVTQFQAWVASLSHTAPDRVDFSVLAKWGEHLEELAKESPTAHYYKNLRRKDFPEWLYVALTDSDEILYIGITKNPSTRIQQHIDLGAPWACEPVRIEWHGYPDRETVKQAERDLIREYDPPFNKQHTPNYSPWRRK